MSRNKHPEETVRRILESSFKLFSEKGYDKTTIQDIVDELGDLSKGAIYHHFKSKEDIIETLAHKVHEGIDFSTMYQGVKGMTGREKIKQLILYSVKSEDQRALLKTAPSFMKNPKFLVEEVRDAVEVLPEILVPYIEEGNADGSLHVTYPEEAAEVLMLLSNIWLNPLVFNHGIEKYVRRLQCLGEILAGMGLAVMDEEVMEAVKELQLMFET